MSGARHNHKRGIRVKYLGQFAVILAATFAGEAVKALLGLPIPGGVYGLIPMFPPLASGAVKLERVRGAVEFLVEIMPVMFIPAAAGLIASRDRFRGMPGSVRVFVSVSTALVFGVTGRVADFLTRGGK